MKEDGGEEVEEGGEGRGERGRPQVRPLQQFVRAETEKSQATPAQKSQVTPDRSHKRPLYQLAWFQSARTPLQRSPLPALALFSGPLHCASWLSNSAVFANNLAPASVSLQGFPRCIFCICQLRTSAAGQPMSRTSLEHPVPEHTTRELLYDLLTEKSGDSSRHHHHDTRACARTSD